MLSINHKTSTFLFGLLVFVLVIDPTNTLFKAKELVFALFIGSSVVCKIKISKDLLLVIMVFFFITLLSLCSGFLQGFQFDRAATFSFIKSLLFLFILLFVREFDFLTPLTKASLVIAIVTISVAIIFMWQLSFAPKLYEFIANRDHFIMISEHRYFLGYQVPNYFYKTSPILVIPFAMTLYHAFTSQKKKHYLIAGLFFTALLFSGTRANILSTVLICGLLFLNQIYKNKFWKQAVLLLLPVVFTAFVFILFKFLLEQEESNLIKIERAASMIDVFKEHPLVLLFGQGPGSLYHTSSGIDGVLYKSELSYLEIIRMFGLIGGGLIILIFVLPLVVAHKNRKQLNGYFPFFISYLGYLFIGGTNPLLLGSTGFLALATAYSYVLRKENISIYPKNTTESKL
jgi:hypothetical protein